MAATNGNGAAIHTFTATIARLNDNGLQIQERPGVWLNYSKFGARPAPPQLGATVRITTDARGFIRELVELDFDAAPDGEQPPLPLPAPPPPPPHRVVTEITRLAVLKAAARFLAGRTDVTGDDVLALAADFEAWVLGADRDTEVAP